MEGDTGGRSRLGESPWLVVAAVVAVLVVAGAAAVIVFVVKPGSDPGVAAPSEWAAPSRAEAARSLSYLRNDGRTLPTLADRVEGLSGAPTAAECSEVTARLAKLDPTESLQAAVKVPDPYLRDLYVNLTADIPAALTACRGTDPAATRAAVKQLSATLDYIAARNDQLTEAAG